MRRSRKPLYVLLAYREVESLPLRCVGRTFLVAARAATAPSRRPREARDSNASGRAGIKLACKMADIHAGMLHHPSSDEQAAIAETLRRPRSTMTAREWF